MRLHRDKAHGYRLFTGTGELYLKPLAPRLAGLSPAISDRPPLLAFFLPRADARAPVRVGSNLSAGLGVAVVAPSNLAGASRANASEPVSLPST